METPGPSRQPLPATSEALACPLTTEARLGSAKSNSTAQLSPAPIVDPHNCKASKLLLLAPEFWE